MATGGEAVGKLADGRVVFIRGALVGERVVVQIEEEKTRFARGVATEILVPSDHTSSPGVLTIAPVSVVDAIGCMWLPEAKPRSNGRSWSSSSKGSEESMIRVL